MTDTFDPTLAELGITGRAAELLTAEGLTSLAAIETARAENGDLTYIKGIGQTIDDEVVAAIEQWRAAGDEEPAEAATDAEPAIAEPVAEPAEDPADTSTTSAELHIRALTTELESARRGLAQAEKQLADTQKANAALADKVTADRAELEQLDAARKAEGGVIVKLRRDKMIGDVPRGIGHKLAEVKFLDPSCDLNFLARAVLEDFARGE